MPKKNASDKKKAAAKAKPAPKGKGKAKATPKKAPKPAAAPPANTGSETVRLVALLCAVLCGAAFVFTLKPAGGPFCKDLTTCDSCRSAEMSCAWCLSSHRCVPDPPDNEHGLPTGVCASPGAYIGDLAETWGNANTRKGVCPSVDIYEKTHPECSQLLVDAGPDKQSVSGTYHLIRLGADTIQPVWQLEGPGDTMQENYLWFREEASDWLLGPGFGSDTRPAAATIKSNMEKPEKEEGEEEFCAIQGPTHMPYEPMPTGWFSVKGGKWLSAPDVSVTCVDKRFAGYGREKPPPASSLEPKPAAPAAQEAAPATPSAPKAKPKPKVMIDKNEL